MRSLLKKELRLALHPTVPIFLLFSAMLLIPSYPYGIIFFYTGLAVFFTCLSGRENGDVLFSMLLPVAKRDVIRARLVAVVLAETAQLLTAIPFAVLRRHLSPLPNFAGMDANVAMFALALMQYGLFNVVFFEIYARNVRRVGTAFLAASAAIFLFIAGTELLTRFVPFFRALDTPDPRNLPVKLGALGVGLAVMSGLTALADVRARRHFERQDL